MSSKEQIIDYFRIVDIFQQVSLHKEDHATKVLILFHSMHASIYYAIWYGLYDTLQVICEKIDEFKTNDLVAAEMDYSLGEFTKEIISSIKTYADSFEKQTEATDGSESGEKTYTAAPMKFSNE